MKILVISDTHGELKTAENVMLRHDDVDLTVHLGDFYKDAKKLEELTEKKILAVKGNCDGAYDDGEFAVLETEFGKIYISHGHLENVKSGFLRISYKASEKGCKVVLCGHIHKPVDIETEGSIRIINPGSIGSPLPGRKPSYAVIETSEKEIKCEILTCDEESAKKKTYAPAGEISAKLNYSDRF